MKILLFIFGLVLVYSQSVCKVSLKGSWYTSQENGNWYFYNDALGGVNILRGVSLSGFETGIRNTSSGAGYSTLFASSTPSPESSQCIISNVIKTLTNDLGANIIRIPFCGSSWLQNYQITDPSFTNPISYRDWLDYAVCEALKLGAVVILDNHLWAIGPETTQIKNEGMEDGCTGISSSDNVNSCAPHDWYGMYTSERTGITYNAGDDPYSWQCPITHGDGCSLDNLLRNSNRDHLLNLWYEIALRYRDYSYVWFEIVGSPYQRGSAEFGKETGDEIPEIDYDWDSWSDLMFETIKVIRDGAHSNNIIIVPGLDWNYDWLGDSSNTSFSGPINRKDLIKWITYGNISYSFHPYQYGSCCGAIGSDHDYSQDDPYQSAYCMYPPTDMAGPVPSNSALPIPSMTCSSTGFTTTKGKKLPPCIWAPLAHTYESNITGLCVGEIGLCDKLTKDECTNIDWNSNSSGGWSKWVLPMQVYGPLISTEFGTFDCSSPFTLAFIRWARQFGVSYTAWAIWPMNSGLPSGACGYPSIVMPSVDESGYGKGTQNCGSYPNCSQFLKPLPYSGALIVSDMNNDEKDLSLLLKKK